MAERMIMDDAAINRALTRMSHEILEKNKGTKDIVLLGVKTRGVHLANRIEKKIKSIEDVQVPTGEIDVTHYRDDVEHSQIKVK
ncbi:MAG TPA: bifunctional pyr operon transcriptional regulator/uracil phosphoribosyltransferase, partial [Mammaliicoccus lentus]|nr:bifunctional pyr operon transcriptional regulator/uracil phosphoribosyltransferase [Mammaliicoccus lentus]